MQRFLALSVAFSLLASVAPAHAYVSTVRYALYIPSTVPDVSHVSQAHTGNTSFVKTSPYVPSKVTVQKNATYSPSQVTIQKKSTYTPSQVTVSKTAPYTQSKVSPIATATYRASTVNPVKTSSYRGTSLLPMNTATYRGNETYITNEVPYTPSTSQPGAWDATYLTNPNATYLSNFGLSSPSDGYVPTDTYTGFEYGTSS